MKILKRLFAVVLTLVLSFYAVSNVAAEGEGSITVNGTTAEKTYEIYRIFDLTLSQSGKVAYTINSDWTGFFAEGEAGAAYLTGTAATGLSSITIDGVTKYINVTESNVADFAQAALDYASKHNIAADYSKNAETTSLTFNNLELGYYLVYPKGATDIKPGNASICSLTSTTPDGTVNIKAEYPTIEKDVNDYSVEVGQTVTFTVTGQVPDTTGYTTYTYEVKDTMSSGLLFNSSIAALELTINGTEVTVTEESTLAANGVEISYANNGFVLTIDMVKFQGTDGSNVGKDVVITYNAKVTKDAINSTTTKNSAVLTYSNDPKDSTKKTENPPVVKYLYSANILVIKVDGVDKTTKLAGAEFVLRNEDGKFYQATMKDGVLESIKWVTNKSDATKYTTDKNGNITFEGLEDGTYYLVETKAPEGYNLLVTPTEVVVKNAEGVTENEQPTITPVTSTVENNSGTELPTTGGFGTKLFITIGSLLAIVSAIVLVTNKRMSKEF